MIKRSWEADEVETLAMQNSMMLLTRVGQSGRAYNCNTCNKQFKSFQALGAHRASHKRTKTTNGDKNDNIVTPTKAKTYECSVCGLGFAVGQALGGHMRRHRDGGPVEQVREKRGLCVDLNLTPYENVLKVWSGYDKTALAI